MKNNLHSMTGFGSYELQIDAVGRVSVELRCVNHKFLEAVFNLPDGWIALEDKLKKELEGKINRGRIYCAINIKEPSGGIFLNRKLIKNYLHELKSVKKEFKINDELSLDSLLHLPGVLSLKENKFTGVHCWEQIKPIFLKALAALLAARQKEGKALAALLKDRCRQLQQGLVFIRQRYATQIKTRLSKIPTSEEKLSFLKSADIAEELDRLNFHIKNFQQKISQGSPVGKELDFITQEMQREANTLAAKSFDLVVSGKAVEAKSQIEKIREQVQNIE